MISQNVHSAGKSDIARARVLSITFDDGLVHGSEVACEILSRYELAATFYIVTGWVEPTRSKVCEPYNVGRSHGDWAHWRAVRDAGHEVGSHTFSHINAGGKKSRLMPWRVQRELAKSRDDLVREVPQQLYTISMPWNAATPRSERYARKFYSACRLGCSTLAYNQLSALKPYSLELWPPSAPVSATDFSNAIAAIPKGGWLILQFHSFDDEGWDPISRGMFEHICSLAAEDETLKVLSVAQVLGSLKH